MGRGGASASLLLMNCLFNSSMNAVADKASEMGGSTGGRGLRIN